MQLTVVFPYGKKVYAVSWIELNTPVGNFVVLPGHASTIVTLSYGEAVTFGLTNGKRESFIVNHGVAHITSTSATLLVNAPQ